jgi:subtilisin family serine protease
MRRLCYASIILLLFFFSTDSLAGEAANGAKKEAEIRGGLKEGRYHPDRILIQSRRGQAPAAIEALHRGNRARVIRVLSDSDEIQVVQLPEGTEVREMVARYRNSGRVEWAEPDYWIRPVLAPGDDQLLEPAFRNSENQLASEREPQAGIQTAGLSATGSSGDIIVAVIDTGVRYTHQDLAGRMWVNPGETGLDGWGLDRRSNGRDDDGNGYVDDVFGMTAMDKRESPFDTDGHGTHVAGILVRTGTEEVSFASMSGRIQIMALKFMDGFEGGFTSDAIKAIDYARAKGAQVINASWGSPDYSYFLENAIRKARNAGIFFVAAAGNDGINIDEVPFYPASFSLDNLVSVAATTDSGELASFSNFGVRSVHLAAPGAAINSTYAGSDSDYRRLNGTSMAAPHAAAVLALVRARYPDEGYRQIIQRVLSATDALPHLAGKTVTGGRINLEAALGINPETPASLQISRAQTPDFRLTLTGKPGQHYQLETSWDFVDWFPWQTVQVPAGGVLQVTDGEGPGPQRFYRALIRN